MSIILRAPNSIVVEWSKTTDGPLCAFHDPETMRRYQRARAIRRAAEDFDRDWPERAGRLAKTGTSSLVGDDWGGCLVINTCGRNHGTAGEKALLQKVEKMADECERRFAQWEREEQG